MTREKWAAGHHPALQESAGQKCLVNNGLQDTPRLRFKNLKGGRGGVSHGDAWATQKVKHLALYAGMIPKRGGHKLL